MSRPKESPNFFPISPVEKSELLGPLLSSVGRPINETARTIEIRQGQPIYFITTLPFNVAFPILTKATENPGLLEVVWQEFNRKIVSFYARSQQLASVPIWMVDEMLLASPKASLIKSAQRENPRLTVCSTERFCLSSNSLRLQINRVIPLTPDAQVVRNDKPSFRAERPGCRPLLQQIEIIKQIYNKNCRNGFLLEDTGLASGKSLRQIAKMLDQNDIKVTKVIAGLGWYPEAFNALKDYEVECLIWFDLSRGGWVENRDFPLLSQAGILLAEYNDAELRLAQRSLGNGYKIGFTLPDIVFDGRWFRITNSSEIEEIKSICLEGTISLYQAIARQLTVGRLAKIYEDSGSIFTLPIRFGSLNEQLDQISPQTRIEDYLVKNFA